MATHPPECLTGAALAALTLNPSPVLGATVYTQMDLNLKPLMLAPLAPQFREEMPSDSPPLEG